ncbi:MAG: hypothetical protein MJ154_01740 [Candidatus Saccharibacteria bacterium]|nr:hypothetical protein [Candidatus Saccharibacteria bacterium]
MKRFLFARTLRASGRMLLFVGAMLSLGLTAVYTYLFFYRLNNQEAKFEPIQITMPEGVAENTVQSSNPYVAFITAIISVVLAIGLIAVIAKIYNGHIRSTIARIARLFKAQIFTVEIMSTLIVWTITTLYLAFFIPAGAIAATFAFIINELLFLFAWGSYGQPNYEK